MIDDGHCARALCQGERRDDACGIHPRIVGVALARTAKSRAGNYSGQAFDVTARQRETCRGKHGTGCVCFECLDSELPTKVAAQSQQIRVCVETLVEAHKVCEAHVWRADRSIVGEPEIAHVLDHQLDPPPCTGRNRHRQSLEDRLPHPGVKRPVHLTSGDGQQHILRGEQSRG